MIPPRTFNGENLGIGVRYRVSACRRRLRVNRTSHRTNANIRRDEESREIDSGATLGRDTPRIVISPSGAQEEAEST